MDSEILKTVREIQEKVEENNHILHSIQRNARIGRFFRSIYWIVIIGLGVGAFYYVQPYVDTIMKSYSSIKETESKIANFSSWDGIKNYFTSTSTKK